METGDYVCECFSHSFSLKYILQVQERELERRQRIQMESADHESENSDE